MYKIFATPLDNIVDALSLQWLMPWRRVNCREFWALRGINLELKVGRRIGILGRNGAGKTTLLKLITGNLEPTDGRIEVKGRVQALLETGGGFHPEFTGYENIMASLTYQGLNRSEIDGALEDIAEFTELGQFLQQPYKTYSSGMQARLAFATATTIKPEILIIDEILGAGDAYFLNKSAERIRKLVDSGASILLVSHSLDQIVRLCEEAIWLDRGKIVENGPSLEVIKVYEQYIRRLEDHRLKAKNRKVVSSYYAPNQYDNYSHTLLVKFHASPALTCDVSQVVLWRNDQEESRLLVGDAQDTDSTHSGFVMLQDSDWSSPKSVEHGFCRSLVANGSAPLSGTVAFCSYFLFEDVNYSLEVSYRCNGAGMLSLEVLKDGISQSRCELSTDWPGWYTQRISLKGLEVERPTLPASVGSSEASKSNPPLRPKQKVRKWPGEGSLTIDRVAMVTATGFEQAVFDVGTPLRLEIFAMAHQSQIFDVIAAATLYRSDGILVSNHAGHKSSMELKAGETRKLCLAFGPLNLGNGHYVFSVALYRKLSALEPSEPYDLIDRSYEFQVIGNGPFDNGIFSHHGEWTY